MENNQPTNEQKIKNELKKLDRYAFYIGILGIISMFVFTVLATQLHICFDYTNTGQIGDTIGGLTAPIIGIFSALLIYLSFRAQIKANYIVQGQIEKQENSEKEKRELEYVNNLLNELNKEINAFVYRQDRELKIGADAIIQYLNDLNFNFFRFDYSDAGFYKETKNQQYIGLLDILDKLVEILLVSKFKKVDKEYFKSQLQYIVNYKLTLSQDQRIISCKYCGQDHLPLPCILVKRFKLIEARIDFIVPD